MTLAYAADHLRAAVVAMASGERPLQERLQHAWDDHVQMVWMKRCLNRELLRDFKDLWETYTAPADDPHSTKLRELSADEIGTAVAALVDLATRTSVAASLAGGGDEQLATVADLD